LLSISVSQITLSKKNLHEAFHSQKIAAIHVEKSRSKYPAVSYHVFTKVNENRTMNIQRKEFVTSLIILGVLTMILAVLAFAEKTREDGHIPERNGRGSGELISVIVTTGLTGSLVPVIRVLSGEVRPHFGQPALPLVMGMRC
jgi:hypothetical protein